MEKMPSVLAHNFSRISQAEIERSSFDRSHGLKTTFNAGQLIPIFVDEALPGDTFNLKMAGFGRLSTPLHPIMDNIHLSTMFFAVPYRLLWDNWERFNGAQDNPTDSTDFLMPQVDPENGAFGNESLADYLGIPPGYNKPVNALPFRAYNLIYNEWFRDENLQDSLPVPTNDGPDPLLNYEIRRRGKRHDYFTSCLPWPQKGEAINLPLGTKANINCDTPLASGAFPTVELTDGLGNFKQGNTLIGFANTPAQSPLPLYADLTTATASTINDLRQAFQIQRLLERDARGGTRYTEILQAHFGVTSPDGRIQRPEYLGGGKTAININPIAQTSSTDATTPQGNLAAMGTGEFTNHGFNKSFTEHTIIIGLAVINADLTYQNGLDKIWTRKQRYDLYWPALAHLGEQAVYSKELFADGTADDEKVFGYQERYAEYRYKNSKITGQMRSSFPQSLDTWHLSQDFQSRPVLNAAFIEENPPIDRIVAVPTYPHFIFDSYFKLTCARPMPTYGTPGLIDHF